MLCIRSNILRRHRPSKDFPSPAAPFADKSGRSVSRLARTESNLARDVVISSRRLVSTPCPAFVRVMVRGRGGQTRKAVEVLVNLTAYIISLYVIRR